MSHRTVHLSQIAYFSVDYSFVVRTSCDWDPFTGDWLGVGTPVGQAIHLEYYKETNAYYNHIAQLASNGWRIVIVGQRIEVVEEPLVARASQ